MLFQKAPKRSQDCCLRCVSDIRLILGSSASFGTSVSSQLNRVHLGIRHVHGWHQQNGRCRWASEYWKGRVRTLVEKLLNFLSRTDGGSFPNKRNRSRRNAILIYIPVANSFTPERAFFVTKLPFRDAKFLFNRASFAAVFFLEFRPAESGSSPQYYKEKNTKKLRRQLQTPQYSWLGSSL